MKYTAWIHEDLFADSKVDAVLRESEVIGLVISNEAPSASYYDRNKERFPNSLHALMTGIREWTDKHEELTLKYLDEMRTAKDTYHPELKTMETCYGAEKIDRFGKNMLVDEPDIRLIKLYKNKYTCEVTFSAYRKQLYLPFGWRLGLPWTNQIPEWKNIDKEFGSRFKRVWINLEMNEKDFAILIDWSVKHGKDPMLYVDKVSPNDFLPKFNKFNSIMKGY